MAVAYCWATGEIQIGDIMPEGALPIAFGNMEALNDAVNGLATLAYDNSTRLVPCMFTSGNKSRVEIVLDFSKSIQAAL